MRPLEGGHVPLAEVKQADDTHDIDGMQGNQADRHTQQAAFPAARKGHDGGKQDDTGFDTVAARLDGDGKLVDGVVDDDAIGHDVVVKQMNQTDAYGCQQRGKRLHKMLLDRRRQLNDKQRDQQGKKQEQKFFHWKAIKIIYIFVFKAWYDLPQKQLFWRQFSSTCSITVRMISQ